MAGTPLAEAFVRVRALTDKFKDDVEKGLSGIGDDFGKQFSKDASARLRDERGRFAAAGAELGDAAGDAAGREFGESMAEEGAVQFGNDGNVFVKVGRKVGGDAGEAAGQEFSSRFWRDANGRWHDERGRFVSAAEATGEDAGEGFNRGFGRKVSRIGDVGQRALASMLPALNKLAAGFASVAAAAGKVLATIGKWGALAAGVAALGAAAASSAGYVVELTAALAPVSGLMAGLPGIALTGAAAFTTWKLATAGLGKALSEALAGDHEAFSEAIVDMSEAGRTFAIEFFSAAEGLRQFQEDVQGAFLSEMTGHLNEWVSRITLLQPAVAGLASEFGALMRTLLDFATSSRSITSFNRILGGTLDLISALRRSLDPLLRGFVDLGVVGNQWLAGFAPALQRVLTTFGQWMSEISRSGQAMAWLNDATKVLQQLGRLIGDLWGALTGLLDAATKAGGNALGVLGQLVAGMNQWVNSAKGQEILVTIFRALQDIGRALLPVITSLAGAIAAIAPVAAELATALGPILGTAITALGKGIAAMGPGLMAMVAGIGKAVSAVAPLLTSLGSALGDVLAELGHALALIIPQIAEIAIQLAPALTGAVRALAPALAALGPGLVTVAQYLAVAFASPEVQRGLIALGKGISDVLIAAAPLLPIIAQLAGILAQALGQALTNVGAALGPIISALAGALAPALRAVSDALAVMLPYMTPIYEAFGQIAAAVITELLPPVLNLIPALISGLIPAMAELARQVQPLIPLMTSLAVELIQRVLPAILPILPELTTLALRFTELGLIVAQVVASFAPAIERAIAIFQHLYDVLVGNSIVPDLINAIRDWFQRGVDWVKGIVGWFGELPGMFNTWMGSVVGIVSTRWDEIRGRVADAMGNVVNAVTNGLNNIISAVSGGISWVLGAVSNLPGQIQGALGNMGGLLYSAGSDLVIGFYNGIVSMWNWLISNVQSLFGSVADWAKSVLGIASPSKVFKAIGKELPAGMVIGMDQGRPMLEAAAGRMSDATVGTFTTPESPPPALQGTFGAPAVQAAAPAGGGVTIENITIRGVLDPSNPISYRQVVEQLREEIRQLEREVYA